MGPVVPDQGVYTGPPGQKGSRVEAGPLRSRGPRLSWPVGAFPSFAGEWGGGSGCRGRWHRERGDRLRAPGWPDGHLFGRGPLRPAPEGCHPEEQLRAWAPPTCGQGTTGPSRAGHLLCRGRQGPGSRPGHGRGKACRPWSWLVWAGCWRKRIIVHGLDFGMRLQNTKHTSSCSSFILQSRAKGLMISHLDWRVSERQNGVLREAMAPLLLEGFKTTRDSCQANRSPRDLGHSRLSLYRALGDAGKWQVNLSGFSWTHRC